jgi:hypothetical protein
VTVKLKASLLVLLLPVWLVAGCTSNDTITTPTTPTPPAAPRPSPFTESFSSFLPPQGFAAHGFILPSGGTITATLTTLGAPANVQVGFGLGVPGGATASCSLNQSVNTRAGATLTALADPGTYCIAVYDIGGLTTAIPFSVTIVYP